MYSPEIEQRFWNKVDRRGSDDCWPWIGARNAKGYGVLRVKGTQGWHNVLAHRFAHEQFVGPIEAGHLALHACDNRPCVNPAHLHSGSAKQNTREMMERGRDRHGQPMLGDTNANAKISDEVTPAIRAAYVGGEGLESIASRYGVDWKTIRRIITRKRFSRVNDDLGEIQIRRPGRPY